MFPRTTPALREVHGIGDYTTKALASITFNEVVHSLVTRDPVARGDMMTQMGGDGAYDNHLDTLRRQRGTHPAIVR